MGDNDDDDDAKTDQCCYGFLANLFLAPRVIDAVTEYWMQNYVPVPLATGALAPLDSSPIEFVTALVRRLYAGCDDICLVGQGNLALTHDANVPRYVHYLNFIEPANHDFSLAIPVRHFLRTFPDSVRHCPTEATVVALIALYLQNKHIWKSAIRAATLGEHLFSYFHVGAELYEWQGLFSPLAYAAEVVYRGLLGLRETQPTEWFYSTEGATMFLRRASEVLSQPRCSSVHSEQEDALVRAYRRELAQILDNAHLSATDRVDKAVARLSTLRSDIRQHVASVYKRVSERFNSTFCLDDMTLFPWQEDPMLTQ